MKKLLEKNFIKWEAKKRAKLGDRIFLEKYTKTFPKSDRIMKILLPILLVLNPINVILQAMNKDYVLMGVWILVTVCWVYVACFYYFFRFGLHKQKVEKWTNELAEMNPTPSV